MIVREKLAMCKAESKLTKVHNKEVLAQLPTQVQLYLLSPYGKNSLNHSFTTDMLFCHILFYLESSGFSTKKNLLQLIPILRTGSTFLRLIADYRSINFIQLKANDGFLTDIIPNQEIDMVQYTQLIAAIIYYKGCIPSFIKYCQGPYTCAHRNRGKTLNFLKSKTNAETYESLKGILYFGCPKKSNAHSSRSNWKEFMENNNHTTVEQESQKNLKASAKDNKRGNVFTLDKRLTQYIPDTHKPPLGIIDINHLVKRQRQF